MTANEMKYELEVKNELIGGLELPDLTDDEISIFLNIGQDKIVEELFKSSGTEFLTELLAAEDLHIFNQHTEIDNAVKYSFATMSTDAIFIVDAALKLTRTNPTVTAQWIQCEKIKKGIAHNFAKTGFNTPWFKNPKIFLENNSVVIIYDNYTTINSDTIIINDAVFEGVGMDDMASGGYMFTGLNEVTYIIEITSVIPENGAPGDLFKWSDDGGITWTENVLITREDQILSNGVTIIFGYLDRHTIGDMWTIPCTQTKVLKFEYIKRPGRIVVDTEILGNEESCELRGFLHKDIVERALIELLDAYKSRMKEEGSKK